jgi:hypothetical protein
VYARQEDGRERDQTALALGHGSLAAHITPEACTADAGAEDADAE